MKFQATTLSIKMSKTVHTDWFLEEVSTQLFYEDLLYFSVLNMCDLSVHVGRTSECLNSATYISIPVSDLV